MDYQDAGVDIEKGNIFVEHIRKKLKFQKGVMGGIGHFSGFFKQDFSLYKEPILVSSCDGVGTKVKIAQRLNNHYSIGIDLVAMCVNDIIATGGIPLFFLDYLAFGRLDLEIANSIMDGIIAGCNEAECSLLGGETAEMPDVYGKGEYDCAGFCVGIVEKEKIITGEKIKKGDIIIGIPSSGLHSNGFSLVRKIIKEPYPNELLIPTKIYVKDFLKVADFSINGISHITGGGLIENIKRLLPSGTRAIIEKKSLNTQEIFLKIQKEGNIPEMEMFKTFNMGIGLCLIVDKKDVDKTLSAIPSYTIGSIEEGERGVVIV
ncbi:MAG: phosphoribosylformylglycinamidine cyclo-ligase [bacterium]